MDRRAFIGTVVGGLVAPLAAEGQQAGQTFRMGVLSASPLTLTSDQALEFRSRTPFWGCAVAQCTLTRSLEGPSPAISPLSNPQSLN
jgi:hypothetical protein